MKPILCFYDAVCPSPYDFNSLGQPRFGGTEQTIIKIAEGIAATGQFDVYVGQHCRTEASGRYLPLAELPSNAQHVVFLRDPRSLLAGKDKFFQGKFYLWSHDLASPNLFGDTLKEVSKAMRWNIAVSNSHKTQTYDVLQWMGHKERFPTKVAWNPIDDNLKPDGTEFDKNKLCFISSPHKGLEYALSIFERLHSINPDFKLHVTNPGYFKDAIVEQPGVVLEGSLSHDKVIALLRSSLCLFYPNTVFPETFGLVMAESDAVGTPVLTHAFGASYEVTDHPQEVMDCRDKEAVVKKVMMWYHGSRPTVRGKPQFRLKNVVNHWIREILA